MAHNNHVIEEGHSYREQFSFTQGQVEQFAELTGDNNPLHLDPEYAAKTPFGKPIVHGVLAGSVFSRILGTKFPGNGTIYIGQNFTFLRPIYIGEIYEAVVEVRSVDTKKHKATLATNVYQISDGRIVIKGQATVMHTTRIVAVPESA